MNGIIANSIRVIYIWWGLEYLTLKIIKVLYISPRTNLFITEDLGDLNELFPFIIFEIVFWHNYKMNHILIPTQHLIKISRIFSLILLCTKIQFRFSSRGLPNHDPFYIFFTFKKEKTEIIDGEGQLKIDLKISWSLDIL